MLNEFVVFPAEIKTEDATHVLAYSIIMLNTDQHNPQIRVSRVLHHVDFFPQVFIATETDDHR